MVTIICLWAVLPAAGFAETGTPEDAIRELERKRFEVQQELREKNKVVTDKQNKERAANDKNLPNVSGENSFILNNIVIENDEHLTWFEKRKIIAAFTGREISFNDINLLVRELTNLLIDKGFATTRVKVPVGQNIATGTLTLSIVNGRIEAIEAEEKSLRSSMQIFMAFPFHKGTYLNVREIEYGLEQMNRLASNNAAMKIEPGAALGMSKVVIANKPVYAFTLEPGLDNLGQESTGEYRAKLFAGFDNLLSLNDSLYFNYTGSPHFDKNREHSRNYTASLSFPFGKWNLMGTYSRSEYMQQVNGVNTKFKTSGNDTSEAFDLERLMFMKGFHRVKAKTALTLKSKETFIEDAKIESSSRKLSVIKAGLDYSGFLLGGYLSIGSFYNRGLPYLGANHDERDAAKDVPRSEFTKFETSLLWNRQFEFFGKKFSYTFSTYGQYSLDTLYSSEKINLGDLNTIRGFKDVQTQGDHGFYIRNDLSFPDMSFICRALAGLKIIAGLDYGQTKEKSVNIQSKAALMGWHTGLRYASSFINFNITYARQVHAPNHISEKPQVVYFSFSLPLRDAYISLSQKTNEEPAL